MEMTKEQIKAVNKTCRSKGAIGKNAIVPRIVKQLAKDLPDHLKILDYGAGKDATHAQQLRQDIGPTVFAWEIGDNLNSLHDVDALSGLYKYSIVYASNVLNVLPSGVLIGAALKEMYRVLIPDGFLVVNYPKEPRKSDVSAGDLEKMLRMLFPVVLRDGLLFVCIKEEEK